MGGGFYEPIMTMLSDADKIGQINLFSDYLKEQFGAKPTGMWLADRVWEQYLAWHINEAGLKYTVLDDFHFNSAGIPANKVDGYYVTEEAGKSLFIFAASEKLRYAIPFKSPEVIIEILRQFASESGDKIVVYADDGEKFGAWPETYKHCYEAKWLERFFQTLCANQDWINFITFKDALDKFKPSSKVYLPDASYREMTEWALPTGIAVGYTDLMERLKQCGLYEKAFDFIKGGSWRNFKVKYPEINLMYARMCEVSELVNSVNKKSPTYQTARLELYRGQCNCAYWHGVFGGFYLPHLRYNTYKYLINAENLVLKEINNTGNSTCISDFDFDGSPEVKMASKELSCYFKPHQGGVLYEFDITGKGFNLLTTITRRQEAYHYNIIKNLSLNSSKKTGSNKLIRLSREKGLENLLYYDKYSRMSLLDHFFSSDSRLDEVAKSHYKEEGDFLNGNYSFELSDGQKPTLTLTREGKVNKNDKNHSIQIVKTISFLDKPDTCPNDSVRRVGLKINYRITNTTDIPLETIFGVEFNFAMVAGESPDKVYIDGQNNNLGNLVSSGESKKQTCFGIRDLYHKLEVLLQTDKNADIWYFPVQSISQSEEGFELIYQNSVIIPRWNIQLKPNQAWQVKILKKINQF